MPRLFIAIDLPEDTKDAILQLRQDDLPPGRWSRREALHLTLHFIGDVPEAVARAYGRILREVDAPAFEMRIAGVGQFPIEARPRVIWAGVENTPPLRDVYEAVGQALAREGFQRERRRFHPHITLMRFKKPLRRGLASTWLREHMDFFTEPFPVTDFALYESDLQPSGAVYRARQVYDLESAPK
ncbi:MAG: RNA 2',3'-cyclic phosphodiesterase [Chloroflexota bacterium]|nr:RNA 2',3'-cyclic phosphodiesterase [Chloroflexota bacterium]